MELHGRALQQPRPREVAGRKRWNFNPFPSLSTFVGDHRDAAARDEPSAGNSMYSCSTGRLAHNHWTGGHYLVLQHRKGQPDLVQPPRIVRSSSSPS